MESEQLLTKYVQKFRRSWKDPKMKQEIVYVGWKNELEFEVDHVYNAHQIDNLVEGTCTCRRWQINGISCTHACVAIYMHKQRPE
jgi:hypothetical protein